MLLYALHVPSLYGGCSFLYSSGVIFQLLGKISVCFMWCVATQYHYHIVKSPICNFLVRLVWISKYYQPIFHLSIQKGTFSTLRTSCPLQFLFTTISIPTLSSLAASMLHPAPHDLSPSPRCRYVLLLGLARHSLS